MTSLLPTITLVVFIIIPILPIITFITYYYIFETGQLADASPQATFTWTCGQIATSHQFKCNQGSYQAWKALRMRRRATTASRDKGSRMAWNPCIPSPTARVFKRYHHWHTNIVLETNWLNLLMDQNTTSTPAATSDCPQTAMPPSTWTSRRRLRWSML